MHPPKKPFSEYKWRWAALTPTESLNAPPVFLGVLRAFGRYEKHPPNSPELRSALEIVQAETGTTVNLGRTRDRNLVRNSGQYWKALGLLEEAHGVITLTDFGRALAGAHITPVEFALTTVKTLELPNKRISGNTDIWDLSLIHI